MSDSVQDQHGILTLEEQSNLYLLFAHLFLGNVKKIKKIIEDVEILPTPSGNEFIDELNDLMKNLKEVPTRELKILYENLFYIPGAFYVPPYGAQFLYGKHDDVSTSQFLGELAFEYEREGYLQYANSTSHRVDHLGLMFMYLHFLLEKVDKNDEIEVERAKQKVTKFIRKKINPWFGEFEKNVSSSLQYGFYLDLVQYIHQLLDCETRKEL